MDWQDVNWKTEKQKKKRLDIFEMNSSFTFVYNASNSVEKCFVKNHIIQYLQEYTVIDSFLQVFSRKGMNKISLQHVPTFFKQAWKNHKKVEVTTEFFVMLIKYEQHNYQQCTPKNRKPTVER